MFNSLDSLPQLELVSYLPEFLDGLIKFVSKDSEEIIKGSDRINAMKISDGDLYKQSLDIPVSDVLHY